MALLTAFVLVCLRKVDAKTITRQGGRSIGLF